MDKFRTERAEHSDTLTFARIFRPDVSEREDRQITVEQIVEPETDEGLRKLAVVHPLAADLKMAARQPDYNLVPWWLSLCITVHRELSIGYAWKWTPND